MKTTLTIQAVNEWAGHWGKEIIYRLYIKFEDMKQLETE